MTEPKTCSNCGKPIAPNQTLCHECHADYWLDEVYEGEGGSVPDYHEDWDDGDYDDIEEEDFDDYDAYENEFDDDINEDDFLNPSEGYDD